MGCGCKEVAILPAGTLGAAKYRGYTSYNERSGRLSVLTAERAAADIPGISKAEEESLPASGLTGPGQKNVPSRRRLESGSYPDHRVLTGR
jgi:hypothetical protein